MNNDGAKHRKEIGHGGSLMYSWLIKNNFPPGFQLLCMNCNFAKGIHGGICPHTKDQFFLKLLNFRLSNI